MREKRRTRTIRVKIANRRKDAMHKFTTELVKGSGAIFVGDVATAAMIKMGNGKSTLDAGWAMFKTMMKCKSHQAGVVFEEVKEAWSTQTCSACAPALNERLQTLRPGIALPQREATRFKARGGRSKNPL